jgi:hypothetical protein
MQISLTGPNYDVSVSMGSMRTSVHHDVHDAYCPPSDIMFSRFALKPHIVIACLGHSQSCCAFVLQDAAGNGTTSTASNQFNATVGVPLEG